MRRAGDPFVRDVVIATKLRQQVGVVTEDVNASHYQMQNTVAFDQHEFPLAVLCRRVGEGLFGEEAVEIEEAELHAHVASCLPA